MIAHGASVVSGQGTVQPLTLSAKRDRNLVRAQLSDETGRTIAQLQMLAVSHGILWIAGVGFVIMTSGQTG